MKFFKLQNKLTTKIYNSPYLISMGYLLILTLLIVVNYTSTLSNPLIFDSRYMLPEDELQQWYPGFNWKIFWNGSRYFVKYLFGLNYFYFNLDPFAFRVINVGIHILNSCLIFIIFKKIYSHVLKNDGYSWQKISFWAFVSTFLYALNPVALYGVVYVVQRYILIATFISLLAIYSFLKGLIDGRDNKKYNWIWYYVSAILFFVAVRCKEQAVMLPAIFFVLTILIVKINKKNILQLLIPFILYFLTALQITFTIKNIVGQVYEPFAKYAVNPVNQNLFFGNNWDTGNAYYQSVFNQTALYFKYLYLWLIPDYSKMAFDLPMPFNIGFFNFPYILGFILFFAYFAYALKLLLKGGIKGLVGFGLLWPWVLFITELSTVRFHENFVLYRSYFWFVGFYCFIPFVFNIAAKKRILNNALYVFLGLYFCLQIFVLQHRLKPFTSRLSVWQDVIQRVDLTDKTVPAAYRSVGNYAGELGNQKKMKQAFHYYKISTELNPHYDKAWYGMAGTKLFEQNYPEAIVYLNRAVKENPLLQQGYYWLGISYLNLKNYDLAIKNFELVTRGFNQDYLDASYKLANTLFLSGRFNLALTHYKSYLSQHPQHQEARLDLALILKGLKRYDEAILAFLDYNKNYPNNSEVLYNLGTIYGLQNKVRLALKYYTQLLTLQPNHDLGLHGLGIIKFRLGQKQEAKILFERALKINPDLKQSQQALDILNNGEGKF
ncbi:hypothetical protein BVY03_03075 [bacterium K02(2017)]|nr:hypothetical protein BVY03_03075 [bacterium K02(2017)]